MLPSPLRYRNSSFTLHEVCDAGDEAEDLPLLCGVVMPAESTSAAQKPEKLCLKPVRHSVKLFMKPENFEKPFMKTMKPLDKPVQSPKPCEKPVQSFKPSDKSVVLSTK